ncbi:MAG: hypothetical protein ACREVZ_00560 [Burkholderiales bacterium]
MTPGPRILLVLAAMLPLWATHAAEPLGRLFFTPSQRAALDAGKQVSKPRTARAVAPRGPRAVTLNGVVTRSDGGTAVWINGRAADGKGVPGVRASASATDPTSAQLRVGGAPTSVRLRVGQQLNRMSGKVLEPYESATSSAAAVVHSPKKSVREDAPAAAGGPDKTSEADADEPSNE